MGKLFRELQKQLGTTDNLSAKSCLIIYDKLKELSGGKVWETEWRALVKCTLGGTYPNYRRVYKPSQIGVIFLKGIFN